MNDGRRTIERDRVNFVAKFDVDNGAATDLSLESSMYDGSPSAEYESWLLLNRSPMNTGSWKAPWSRDCRSTDSS